MKCLKAVVLNTNFEQHFQEKMGHSGAVINITFHPGPPCRCTVDSEPSVMFGLVQRVRCG